MGRPYFQRRPQPAPTNRPKANLQIRALQLRIIGTEGEQLGVMSTSDALKLAQEQGLDLIEISPNVNPPIAKILDYGKYMYQQEKSGKNKKASQAGQIEIKNVRVGLKTGEHDMQVKAALADKFLQKNHKVKLEIALRGREKKFRDLAKAKLITFMSYLLEPNIVEEQPKATPNGFAAIVKRDKKK